MTAHDVLVAITLAVAAWNAFTARSIEIAVLKMKNEINGRIAKAEGEIAVLKALFEPMHTFARTKTRQPQ